MASPDAAPPGTHNVFVPLLIVAVTLLVMMGFQCLQLLRDRDSLNTHLENQTTPHEEAQAVRDQLRSVAQSTAKLAQAGNENALRIVQQLEQAGVTIQFEEPGAN